MIFFNRIKDKFQNLNYPKSDLEDLFINVLGISFEDLILGDFNISQKQEIQIKELVDRRLKGEPIAYILGHKAFWKYDFKVTKDTLIPRPETEVLLSEVIKLFKIKKFSKEKKIKILDLGTGTGCILISLLKEIQTFGYNAWGLGVDLSQNALEVAKYNAKSLDVKEVDFLYSSWNDLLLYYPETKFDLVLSNPPYIATKDIEMLEVSVKDFEPHTALDGGLDGLDCYKQIISLIPKITSQDSIIAFEFGFGQAEDIKNIFKTKAYRVAKDLSGIDRVLISK